MNDIDIIPELKLINDMIEGKVDYPIVPDVEGLSDDCSA